MRRAKFSNLSNAFACGIVGLLSSLFPAAPAQAQFAYRSNVHADQYSVIDWKPGGRGGGGFGGGGGGGNIVTPFAIDMPMPAGCLVLYSDICAAATGVDPVTRVRLPSIFLLTGAARGYYAGYMRGLSSPGVPVALATIVDTTTPAQPLIVATVEIRYFNDAVRNFHATRVYAAPIHDAAMAPHLSIYELPCPTANCVPTTLSLSAVGPGQIPLQPLTVALSEDERVLWVAGVDSRTNDNGGIVAIETGRQKGSFGRGNPPKIIAFIACPALGPMCR